ncbi:hypothetical protein AALO_G00085890 [Alosa alosa]|uniref:LITAF domain-containing protein n=1 Tax=Alosa alosa TaxID=278164 RepID=A0AAV6GYH4_9TELE|nr:uncharacterized protein LOC125296663 [Alosa alosa]KAG5280178.1 hypothetical protein AALO_G00085890 [Alosa alosa]
METVAEELNYLSIRRRQLHDRYTILTMLRDFRHQTDPGMTDTREEAEIEAIQKELDILSVKKKDLLEKQERLNLTQHRTGMPINVEGAVRTNTNTQTGSSHNIGHSPDSMKTTKENPHFGICYIGPPPDAPAPKVIMDVEELPPYPAKTQCPYCYAFVTTEITHTVGPVVWLVCTMSFLVGCAAGCCLLPFCIKNFKDVNHKCPKCRSFLHTVKKL